MFYGELRDFQVEAFERMVEEASLLVAYDMGLGKTVLTIAALEHLLEADEVEAGLLVVPASLKYQWAKSIRKFTNDEPNVLVIDGPPKKRQEQYELAMDWAEYIIMGYSQVVDDWKWVRNLPRDFVVLDEATYIKNFRAQRTRKVKRLQAPYRYALTGQPVENRPEEVFSVMEWVDPDVLGRFDLFDRAFIVRNNWGGVQRYRNLKTLNKRLTEAMVRKKRTDPDVRDQLPDVAEKTESVVLDPKSKKLYRIIARDLLKELENLGGGSNFDLASHYGAGDDDPAQLRQRARIMSRLMCLRMLCDHPMLLDLSAKKYEFGQEYPNEGMKAGSAYAYELLQRGDLDGLPNKSKKLTELVRVVNEIVEADPERNKVVVFSYFKPMLKWVQHALKEFNPVLFTGDLSAKAKQKSKDTFEDDPTCKVFLSSDAGGYGVDLPVANYLINLDLPWSAGAIDQRNARIIRLSTEHDSVYLLNLLIAGSIEERQYDMLEDKRAIASAIVDGKTNAAGSVSLKLTTLREFLQESNV